MSSNKKIMIILYSVYGHVETLAKAILEGISLVDWVKAEIKRVPETENIIHYDEFPVLTYDKFETMENYDGFLFGMSTRDGMMPAPMKAFWDLTGGKWYKGSLCGKAAGSSFPVLYTVRSQLLLPALHTWLTME